MRSLSQGKVVLGEWWMGHASPSIGRTRGESYAPTSQAHWIKIWVGNAVTRTPTYFDMDSIWVLPDKPIQLWFRNRDGSWWFWPELRAGNIWNVSEWVRNVSEVRIRGAESGPGPYTIGAVGIRD